MKLEWKEQGKQGHEQIRLNDGKTVAQVSSVANGVLWVTWPVEQSEGKRFPQSGGICATLADAKAAAEAALKPVERDPLDVAAEELGLRWRSGDSADIDLMLGDQRLGWVVSGYERRDIFFGDALLKPAGTDPVKFKRALLAAVRVLLGKEKPEAAVVPELPKDPCGDAGELPLRERDAERDARIRADERERVAKELDSRSCPGTAETVQAMK